MNNISSSTNLSAKSLKVLNCIFVKSSQNIKVMVVFITTCHSLVYTFIFILCLMCSLSKQIARNTVCIW